MQNACITIYCSDHIPPACSGAAYLPLNMSFIHKTCYTAGVRLKKNKGNVTLRPNLIKNNSNHPETQRNKLLTSLDPDSSLEKCCLADALISHLPLENIKTGLNMGVSWLPICSLI